MGINNRLTITDVAKSLGITPRTIMRWEKAGKIKKSKRDWRGWRFYHQDDLDEIKRFFEGSYDYNGDTYDREGIDTQSNMDEQPQDNREPSINKVLTTAVLILAGAFAFSGAYIVSEAYAGTAFAKTEATPGIKETANTVEIDLEALPTVQRPATSLPIEQEVKYTLGPNDIIAITVRNHPEFSGEYTINSEGKIEYKFVGDLYITGMNKVELKDQLTDILSEFIIEPDVDVAIVAYLSKVFYVVGEVGRPGKFYMRGNTIDIREALFQSGLPTYAAAMRRCRLITPDNAGRDNYKDVNVYRLLYEGDLKENVDMQPGEVLYVPATVMAKIIRVISPVTNVTGQATDTATRAGYAAGAF